MIYKLIALIGEAGCGKSTIVNAVMREYPDTFNKVVTCTTRPPREGEKDGIDYHFLSNQEFMDKIAAGDFVEITNFRDWYYGTTIESLSNEKFNIGVYNPEGIRHLMQDERIDLCTYYISTEEVTRIARQLNRETEPDMEEIKRRFYADKKDFDIVNLQDLLINDCIRNEYPADILDAVWTINYNAKLKAKTD